VESLNLPLGDRVMSFMKL